MLNVLKVSPYSSPKCISLIGKTVAIAQSYRKFFSKSSILNIVFKMAATL